MDEVVYEYAQVEQKWQQRWFDAHIEQATRGKGKKFFIHFAYPGVSGYLHVGHMRGFSYCDIIARYKRMTGYDVLFPAGFHASGIPSIAFAKKIQRGDADTIRLLQQHGLTEQQIHTLEDPYEVVRYFSTVYVEEYWKRFGYLIDYSRIMTTISPGYQKFIVWQFHQLHAKHLLIQKPHYAPYCPACGPVAVDRSETDVSQGGEAEILEFTVIKFALPDGTILPAATLRPETIFGVTNMWVNPTVTYQVVQVDGERWICSRECIEKLACQFDEVDPTTETIPGTSLIGKTCKIPEVGRDVPILSGIFADPAVATGIVMSVPAHAPYDWIALVESKAPIQPIKIIDVPGFGDNPAREASEQLHVTSQTETKKLDEATELVYKKEFHTGTLNQKCGPYAGIRVSEIKDTVKNDLITKNEASVLREFSQQVICRCKERVVIKKIPDQWFINYSDPDLTRASKDYAQTMSIYPAEYWEELPKILDWFGDRAVIRKGSWLGTEFPYKPGWIIEPISDSTLYPAYYIVSNHVNNQQLTPDEMTDTFFDYIFLGKGTPKTKLWREIKDEFDYWYPVDINLGGKEHKTVHFPVYIMNHVAIFPEQKRPRGLFVHWWVTQKGKEKISKSKGGAEPILEAALTYGVDAMRLYYAHIGAPFVDVEWDSETVMKYKVRVQQLWRQFTSLDKSKDVPQESLDRWLRSVLARSATKVHDAYEAFDLRVASNETFFEMPRDLQWYVKRGGTNAVLVNEFLDAWVRLATPITPHLAEELWAFLGHEPFVSTHSFPVEAMEHVSEADEAGESLLIHAMDDISEILKVTNITPKKISIFTAPAWKQKVLRIALILEEKGQLSMNILMKEIMADPELKKEAKAVSAYASKLAGDIKKMSEADRRHYQVTLHEAAYLRGAKKFLESTFSCPIDIWSADDQARVDPAGKAKNAVPRRPALYIE
jgi:leucyl-tRNA synthetase